MKKYPVLPRCFYFIDGNDGFYGPYLEKPKSKFVTVHLTVTKRNIGVICSNQSDFLNWKKNNDFTVMNLDTKNKFETEFNRYYSIVMVDNLRGCAFDEIIETDYAKENKNYAEIKNMLAICLIR
jgi:hypothetical protein